MQVAVVTRSRPCPGCGEVVHFEVTDEREQSITTNSYEALPRDPFDRMRLDPALASMRRRFFACVAGVVGLIGLATVAHFFDLGSSAKPQGGQLPVAAGGEEAPRKIQHIQPAGATVSLEQRLQRLKPGAVAESVKKDEKLAAPVFEITNETAVLTKDDKAAPTVFEVSDGPTIALPAP